MTRRNSDTLPRRRSPASLDQRVRQYARDRAPQALPPRYNSPRWLALASTGCVAALAVFISLQWSNTPNSRLPAPAAAQSSAPAAETEAAAPAARAMKSQRAQSEQDSDFQLRFRSAAGLAAPRKAAAPSMADSAIGSLSAEQVTAEATVEQRLQQLAEWQQQGRDAEASKAYQALRRDHPATLPATLEQALEARQDPQ